MYLKRLDAQGFKSFANKTTLQFGTGVTCIVGPNGTGKTNVADSLRWVLGEHVSRNLRARKTEDVIFTGSDKRAAMGMAEVSITLDNSEHWLPIEYDEVVVTRRAYRSGDNEYLINNTKVRLKDVIDLFLRAQVGQNSYAFMGQGMVEQVLSLRPEDRRGLIEEAADVRLYRNKLEDAQHKLKATRENMDRARMLVREIEPRITQLERQAGRAVKYRELAQELAATLHAWYAHQWREINEQLLGAIALHDQRSEEFERIKADAKACEDGLVQLRAAIDERRSEISVREDRLRKLQDYVHDLERRTALDSERAKMLAARIDELSAELASLRTDLASVGDVEETAAATRLEAKLRAAQKDLASQRARLAAVDGQIVEQQRAALASEQATARALVAAEDLTRRIAEAADAAARLRRERDAAGQERARAIVELAEWARTYAHIARELSLIGPRLSWAVDDREREVSALEELRDEHTAVEKELRGLRSEMEAAQVRLETIERLDLRPQAPDAGVRTILEAGGLLKRESVPEEIKLDGVIGLACHIIRVPHGLERAIEAALADNLYAIVFERQADVRLATSMLLEGDAGRATMYALDNFQEHRALNLIKERGIIGVASGLVRCDSRYRKLVDTLLGRTVVVQNLALAERVVRRGLAASVVTVDGVLLRPVGAVSAGTAAAVEVSFQHEREMQELPLELERLRPLVAEREEAVAAIAGRIDASRLKVAELSQTVDELRERKSRLETDVAASSERLHAFRVRLSAYSASAAERDDEISRLAAVRVESEQQRDQHAADARNGAAREGDARAALASLTQVREALVTSSQDLAGRVAQLDGEYRSERQVTDAQRAAHERLAKQIETKQAQREQAASEAREVGTRLAATQAEQNGKALEAEALASELAPARQELAQFESRERELAAQLAGSNEKVRSAERAQIDAEHEVRARRDELELLRQTLEAEGLVATASGDVERAPEPEAVPDYEPAEAYAASAGGPPTWLRSEDGSDEGIPPIRGGATVNATEMRDRIAELRGQIRALGPVNEEAATEYEESRERYDFLSGQLNDLKQAEEQLNQAASELELVIRDRFRTTFKQVNAEFERYFNAFFRGGTARLELGESGDDGLPGIEIVAQPPGKKLGSLNLLSGGERSLTAVALLFALLQANPSPICVLDEVDAALDEANVGRFVDELRALSQRTQFIIITHNRRTIEHADTIYGVSMGADSVSRVLSLRLADIEQDLD